MKSILVPKDVAVCPICGKQLLVCVDIFDKNNGVWIAAKDGIGVFCSKEPDYLSGKWAKFEKEHYLNQNCWKRTCKIVIRWVRENLVFGDKDD